MKKSTNRSLKQKRNNFSGVFERQEDDLVLADLQVFPDDTGLTITPLNHLIDNEDAIDRLLLNSGFDTETAPVSSAEEVVAPLAVEISRLSNNALIVEALDAVPPLKKNESLSELEAAVTPDNFCDDEKDALDRLLIDTGFDSNAKEMRQNKRQVETADKAGYDSADTERDTHDNSALKASVQPNSGFQVSAFISDYLAGQTEQRSNTWKKLPVDAEAQEIGIEPAKPEPGFHETDSENSTERIADKPSDINYRHDVDNLQQITAELEGIIKQLKKTDASKSAFINYAALIFSIATLIATTVLYSMLTGIETNILKLTDQVEMLKDTVEISDSKLIPEPPESK